MAAHDASFGFCIRTSATDEVKAAGYVGSVSFHLPQPVERVPRAP